MKSKPLAMDYPGIDLDAPDHHSIQMAIEDAQDGNNAAALKLLEVFAYGLRRGHVDRPLLCYVAGALETIVKTGLDANKALNLKRSGRGRPKTYEAEKKSLRIAVAIHRKMNPNEGEGLSLADAANTVAGEFHVGAGTAQNMYCKTPKAERKAQIALEELDKLAAKGNSSN
ncbi:MAG: hypothetical protein KGL39_53610 [Patescibacteria group bacterium]|nr:hypothetical protein [Patescibacteria group bacterium]